MLQLYTFTTALMLMMSITLMGQTVLKTDGPGETYKLINSVLAPGANVVEVPDCNHESFGRHIEEVFDDELGAYVF